MFVSWWAHSQAGLDVIILMPLQSKGLWPTMQSWPTSCHWEETKNNEKTKKSNDSPGKPPSRHLCVILFRRWARVAGTGMELHQRRRQRQQWPVRRQWFQHSISSHCLFWCPCPLPAIRWRRPGRCEMRCSTCPSLHSEFRCWLREFIRVNLLDTSNMSWHLHLGLTVVTVPKKLHLAVEFTLYSEWVCSMPPDKKVSSSSLQKRNHSDSQSYSTKMTLFKRYRRVEGCYHTSSSRNLWQGLLIIPTKAQRITWRTPFLWFLIYWFFETLQRMSWNHYWVIWHPFIFLATKFTIKMLWLWVFCSPKADILYLHCGFHVFFHSNIGTLKHGSWTTKKISRKTCIHRL